MLPGRPSRAYGTFSGSTSTVLPSRTNVTLNFFVAGVYLVCSMYGLVPPIASVSLRRLNVAQPFAGQRAGKRAIHYAFRQRQSGLIHFFRPGADQLVIFTGHSLSQRGLGGLNGAALGIRHFARSFRFE